MDGLKLKGKEREEFIKKLKIDNILVRLILFKLDLKVGKEVVCVKKHYALTVGKTYTVLRIHTQPRHIGIRIRTDAGTTLEPIRIDIFKTLKQIRKEKLDEIEK